MGWKTIKMEWDLCSSTPWVPLYNYTMFQNPIPRPSCHKSRKTIITQKVLVTQRSNIVHWDQHTQKPICADFWAFLNTFSLYKLIFLFLSGGFKQTAKPFTFCWFWLGNMHQNGLSGTYYGFQACQIQWCRFQVSTISGFWKIEILGDK